MTSYSESEERFYRALNAFGHFKTLGIPKENLFAQLRKTPGLYEQNELSCELFGTRVMESLELQKKIFLDQADLTFPEKFLAAKMIQDNMKGIVNSLHLTALENSGYARAILDGLITDAATSKAFLGYQSVLSICPIPGLKATQETISAVQDFVTRCNSSDQDVWDYEITSENLAELGLEGSELLKILTRTTEDQKLKNCIDSGIIKSSEELDNILQACDKPSVSVKRRL